MKRFGCLVTTNHIVSIKIAPASSYEYQFHCSGVIIGTYHSVLNSLWNVSGIVCLREFFSLRGGHGMEENAVGI